MNEQELTAYIDYYLDNLRSGLKIEDSIHSLMEIVPEGTAILLQRYTNVENREVKEGILHIFKQTFSSIPSENLRAEIVDLFGKEILNDETWNWQPALDLLSVATGDAALEHLHSALDEAIKVKNEKKELWIREVIKDRK